MKYHAYNNNSPVTYRNGQHYSPVGRKVARAIDRYTYEVNSKPYGAGCSHCNSGHTAGESDCHIPDAPFYVVSNDPFMSNWGPIKGLTDVCVVPCADMNEARKVRDYVESRHDQKYIRIVTNKPRSKPGKHLSLLIAWRYNALNLDEPRPAERRSA